MAQKAEYKLATGNTQKIQEQLSISAAEGFKPILMNSIADPKGIYIVVILERVLGS